MTMEQAEARPRVTIMIPTYNQASLVLAAVDSALAQDYPHLEVVVSDDCSSDDTHGILQRRHRDDRLLYHRNATNLGRVANYRRALYELATGDWVVNLDGDDYFTDSGFISASVHAALAHPDIVIVSGRVEVRSRAGRKTTRIPRQRLLDGRECVMRTARREYHLMHMATLYRRAAALPLDFYRADVISSDWECLYRLACHGKVAFVDRIAGVWNARPETSTSQTTRWEAFARNMGIWNAIQREVIEAGVHEGRARRAMDRTRVALGNLGAAHLLAAGRLRDAFRFVLGMEGASSWVKARVLLHYELFARLIRYALTAPRRRTCAA